MNRTLRQNAGALGWNLPDHKTGRLRKIFIAKLHKAGPLQRP